MISNDTSRETSSDSWKVEQHNILCYFRKIVARPSIKFAQLDYVEETVCEHPDHPAAASYYRNKNLEMAPQPRCKENLCPIRLFSLRCPLREVVGSPILSKMRVDSIDLKKKFNSSNLKEE